MVPLHSSKRGRCSCGNPDCAAPGRHPRTDHGLADATTDAEKITRLWKQNPRAKIGIVTGTPGNLIGLETRGNTGRQTLRELIAASGSTLPRTVSIEDGDRRLRLFKASGNPPRSGRIADGVRMLGNGDFIVAPASFTGTGKRRFTGGRAIGEIEIARAPDWIMKVGVPVTKVTDARPTGEKVMPAALDPPVAATPLAGGPAVASGQSDAKPSAEPRRRRGRPPKAPAGLVVGPEPATANPATPTNLNDIPAFLDRRPLPAADQRVFDVIKTTLDSAVFREIWDNRSAVLQHRIVNLLRGMARG